MSLKVNFWAVLYTKIETWIRVYLEEWTDLIWGSKQRPKRLSEVNDKEDSDWGYQMKTYPSWADPRVVWKELNAFKKEISLTESDHFYIALKSTIYKKMAVL